MQARHSAGARIVVVLGSWVGVRRILHLSLLLTASRMALPQDPSTGADGALDGPVGQAGAVAAAHVEGAAARAPHIVHALAARLRPDACTSDAVFYEFRQSVL